MRLALPLEARRAEAGQVAQSGTEAPARPLTDGEAGQAVHQLVRDGVQRYPRLRLLRVGRAVLTEDVDAGALRAEWRIKGEGVADPVVDDADDAPVLAVEPLPPMPLREVVVGPAHVHVAVDHGRVAPVVVGVGRDVARCPALDAKRPRRGQLDKPLHVEARVEGHDLTRPEAVARLIPTALLRRADLLRVAEKPGAGPDGGGLRRERRLPVHDGAVGGGHEVGVGVIRHQGIGQLVRAAQQRQNDQIRRQAFHRRRPSLLHQAARGVGDGQHRRGVDVDVRVEGAEERDRRSLVELPRHAAAMHLHASEELREVLVGAPGQAPVGLAGHDDEVAGPRHPVDRRIPLPQLVDPRCVPDGHRHLSRRQLRGCRPARGQNHDPRQGRHHDESRSAMHVPGFLAGSKGDAVPRRHGGPQLPPRDAPFFQSMPGNAPPATDRRPASAPARSLDGAVAPLTGREPAPFEGGRRRRQDGRRNRYT